MRSNYGEWLGRSRAVFMGAFVAWTLCLGLAMGDNGDDKKGVETSIKLHEDIKKKQGALWESDGTGFAEKSDDGGTVTSGSQKIQVGQAGGEYGKTYSVDEDGYKEEVAAKGEVNVIKGTIERKVETEIVDGATISVEGKGAVTVGAEAAGKASVQVGPDGIKTEGKVGIFVGAKAKTEVSGTLDLKDSLGVKVTGKVEGDVRYGLGAEIEGEAELSWTKIKISGGGSIAKGLGFGGKGTIEIDATKLITGVDMDKVKAANKKAKIISDLARKVKNGEYTMPEGKKFSDMLDDINTYSEWLVKHPQIIPKGEDGKPRNAAELVMEELGFERGPNYGKIEVAQDDSGSGGAGGSWGDDSAGPGVGVGLPHPGGGTGGGGSGTGKLRRFR